MYWCCYIYCVKMLHNTLTFITKPGEYKNTVTSLPLLFIFWPKLYFLCTNKSILPYFERNCSIKHFQNWTLIINRGETLCAFSDFKFQVLSNSQLKLGNQIVVRYYEKPKDIKSLDKPVNNHTRPVLIKLNQWKASLMSMRGPGHLGSLKLSLDDSTTLRGEPVYSHPDIARTLPDGSVLDRLNLSISSTHPRSSLARPALHLTSVISPRGGMNVATPPHHRLN